MAEAGGNRIIWTPSDERVRASALYRFATRTQAHHGDPEDYLALHRWSIEHPEAFYDALWDFVGVVGDKGERAFEAAEDIRRARVFPDATLNYAENLLRGADDRLAIIARGDDGRRRTLTRRELYDRVSQAEQALRAQGIGQGDRVAAMVVDDLEAVILYLAVAAIGAILASCSPDFGPEAAVDRLCQIDPKLLIAAPQYRYGDKLIDVTGAIDAVASGSPSLGRIVLTAPAPGKRYCRDHVAFEDWLAPFRSRHIDFERFPFDIPMVILFTSGTTGKPKAMVHSAGGLLLQHLKEHQLHCDLRPGDRISYFTTCGWMMWNWHISALATEATLVTFDGNPFHPTPTALVDMAEEEDITIFGTSARYIQSCQKVGLRPAKEGRLKGMRTILSTGSPLLPESFDYIYRDWNPYVHLASISGGSDICGCFLGGVPTLPVRRGELQGALLGMGVAVFSEDGREVVGEAGELVCRNAHPTMPLFFWGDDDGSRYTSAYFERFPGVWAHGDLAERHAEGGFVVKGRSDTTLNPGGVRIGTAEIYRPVLRIDAIVDCVAVGQDWEGDQRVILFVQLKQPGGLDADLKERIRQGIRQGASPRHVPARIIEVADIPRTRNGKTSEVAVRETIHGRPVKNLASLSNPDSLRYFSDLAELRS